MQACVEVVDDLFLGAYRLILVEVLVQGQKLCFLDFCAQVALPEVIIYSFDLRSEVLLTRLDPIKLFEVLQVIQKLLVVAVEALLAPNHLIVDSYLLFVLGIEAPIYILVVLCQLVLPFDQPLIHLIERLHEFQIRFLDVILQQPQVVCCLNCIFLL